MVPFNGCMKVVTVGKVFFFDKKLNCYCSQGREGKTWFRVFWCFVCGTFILLIPSSLALFNFCIILCQYSMRNIINELLVKFHQLNAYIRGRKSIFYSWRLQNFVKSLNHSIKMINLYERLSSNNFQAHLLKFYI